MSGVVQQRPQSRDPRRTRRDGAAGRCLALPSKDAALSPQSELEEERRRDAMNACSAAPSVVGTRQPSGGSRSAAASGERDAASRLYEESGLTSRESSLPIDLVSRGAGARRRAGRVQQITVEERDGLVARRPSAERRSGRMRCCRRSRARCSCPTCLGVAVVGAARRCYGGQRRRARGTEPGEQSGWRAP